MQEAVEERDGKAVEAGANVSRLEAELADEKRKSAELVSAAGLKSQELDSLCASVDSLRSDLKSAQSDKAALEDRLEGLQRKHDDEMGDLVDVVVSQNFACLHQGIEVRNNAAGFLQCGYDKTDTINRFF